MWLINKTNALYDASLALLYPQECAVCGASVETRRNGAACAACWRKTRVFSGAETLCWKCGALAEGLVPEETRKLIRCHRCDEDAFDVARACGVYEGALRASVLALKRDSYVAPRLAQTLIEMQQRAPLEHATRIVPVPLHLERERERGFNQAAMLGRALAALTKLPCDEWSLVRTIHTERHRAGMDRPGRRESVDGAFEVVRPRLVEGERVLLIDDVFTTGATVSACAKVLKEAGALEVCALTVARPI